MPRQTRRKQFNRKQKQRNTKQRSRKQRRQRTMKRQWGGNTLSRAESPFAVEVGPLKID